MNEITSEKSPLRVDFLPAGAAGVPGRIGLTFAPGKKGPGMEGVWNRDLAADLERLRTTYDTGLLVSLCEPHELVRFGIPDLHARARALEIEVLPFPMPDGGTPESPAALRPSVLAAIEAAASGRTVVIHCRGGLGRTGLFAACLLCARGVAPEQAMSIVRDARPGAIENGAQEAFVRAFSADGLRIEHDGRTS